MHISDLRYKAGERSFDSLLIRPEGEAGTVRPAVLVFPEAWGLGDHAIERARNLAALGYVALAVDPYGDRAQAADMGGARALMGPILADPAGCRAVARAAFDALATQPGVNPARIAAIGFCFGGMMALELARSGAPLAAAVSFHGGLATKLPAAEGAIRAKLLVCAGADDKAAEIPLLDAFLAEMRAAGADHQLLVFGHAVHSFTNPAADGSTPGVRYDADADRRSWTAMRALFDETLSEAVAP